MTASGDTHAATVHETEKSPHNAISSAWCETCSAAGIWPSTYEALFPMATQADSLRARLEALRGLSDQSAPGPWLVVDSNEGMWPPRPAWEIVNDAFCNPPANDDDDWLAVELHTGREYDARFIAALVNLYRELLADDAAVNHVRAGLEEGQP